MSDFDTDFAPNLTQDSDFQALLEEIDEDGTGSLDLKEFKVREIRLISPFSLIFHWVSIGFSLEFKVVNVPLKMMNSALKMTDLGEAHDDIAGFAFG